MPVEWRGDELASVAPRRSPRTHACHERPQRPRRHAALRLHRPLRAAQAQVHLQDAEGRAGPKVKVRIRRALQASQQGKRGKSQYMRAISIPSPRNLRKISVRIFLIFYFKYLVEFFIYIFLCNCQCSFFEYVIFLYLLYYNCASLNSLRVDDDFLLAKALVIEGVTTVFFEEHKFSFAELNNNN